MPILSAKVDASTYEAFNDVCARHGTNMNRLITRFAASIIANPDVIGALISGDMQVDDTAAQSPLNDITAYTRASAFLAFKRLRNEQPEQYLEILKQLDPKTRQFVKKQIVENGVADNDASPAAPGEAR